MLVWCASERNYWTRSKQVWRRPPKKVEMAKKNCGEIKCFCFVCTYHSLLNGEKYTFNCNYLLLSASTDRSQLNWRTHSHTASVVECTCRWSICATVTHLHSLSQFRTFFFFHRIGRSFQFSKLKSHGFEHTAAQRRMNNECNLAIIQWIIFIVVLYLYIIRTQ